VDRPADGRHVTDESRPRRLSKVAGVAAFAIATVALFVVSRGMWSDALVDSGREWIVPDALSRGGLLYRDVVYWFGPFTPYFHAAFFEVLGSSFRTLVVAGVVGSIGVLAALHVALRTVTEKAEAALWTALAVPALVFMPNAGGSILGMGYRMWHAAAFAMLAVAVLVRRGESRGSRSLALAGALAGLAGLCRTEWGIAALLSCSIAVGVRDRFGRAAIRRVLILGAAALVVFGGVLGAFLLAAGADAVLSDGPVLLFGLPEETRGSVAFAGVRGWRSGLVPLLYSSLLWLGVALTVEVVALRREDRERVRRRLPVVLGILGLLALLAVLAQGTGAVLFSAAPAVCAASLVAGVRRRGRPEAAPLAGFGVLGLLVSHRALFHLSDGPYVAPPLLVAFVCAAGLLQLFATRASTGASSRRLRTGLTTVVAALVVVAFAGRFARYGADDRVAVPGTHGMLSARPETAREIAALASVVRKETREGDGLVVVPEGEILNYLSRRPNPLRHKLYLPGYVSKENEASIVAELERASPAAVVLWRRGTHEYGPGTFGTDYAVRIRRWIDENFELRDLRIRDAHPHTAPQFRYGVAPKRGPA
jgi:hypothetical protein